LTACRRGHYWLAREMDERIERRRLLTAWGIVVVVGLAHRITLFLVHRPQLDALIDANAAWYTFQHLPREMLRDHLFASMVLLQQTPPISNLLLGVALKCFSWPAGVAYAMIWLQTVLTLVTALVLVHVVTVLYPRRVVLWTAMGLLFVLDTGLVVLEYNSMGQTIYGPLAMLFALVVVDRLVMLRRAARTRDAVATGGAAGLLALARSPWSLFPIPCLLLVAGVAPTRKWRAVLACLLPIAVLQGGWALKNYAVYGVFSPVTGTWGGLHEYVGLGSAGLGDQYVAFLRQREAEHDGHPEWVLAFAVNDQGLLDRMPADVRERDQAVERAIRISNPTWNTLAFRTLWAEGQRQFLGFAMQHPRQMLAKWGYAYEIFWQPLENYGRQFVDLFAVDNRISTGFDFVGIVRQLRTGALPETPSVMSGTHRFLTERKGPRRFTRTEMYTPRWLDPFVLMLNVIGVHVLLPLVGLVALARRAMRAPPVFDALHMAALLVAATIYGYLAVIVNLIETLENMRYRQEVEPVVWLITLVSLTALADLVRGAARRRVAAA